jgi:hypothetical protein
MMPGDRKVYIEGWNAAIHAASKSVVGAPIFPKNAVRSALSDGERITILESCRKQVIGLLKPLEATIDRKESES